MTDIIPTGGEGGANPTPNPTDIYAELRGKKDANGIPQHPEERAEFYKKKFADSSAGAQQLLEENKRLKEQTESQQAQSRDKFTETDLSREIPDWDILTMEQKKAMINSMGSLMKDLEKVKAQVAEIVDEREFEKTFKKVTSEPEFLIIKKHKREFRDYAYQDSNLNVPLPILARSFLVDKNLIGAKPPETNQDAGLSGLDSGSGGDRKAPPKTGYTSEEMETIRKTDPKKYNRLAREGKLVLKD